MNFIRIPLEGSFLVNLEQNKDDRGFFARLFCQDEFVKMGLNDKWVQINNSYNEKKGTMRGLHFQRSPNAEIKLVRCLKGAIWDVIVDLRYESKTYGKWFGAELNEQNRTMMYVPRGFAHGFITLVDKTEIIYFVSNPYVKELEEGLLWNDDFINIKWPIYPSIISNKDKSNKEFKLINTK
jgi:dTDP-4-dehydrorhamnose 3,5-epimerase